MSVLDFGCGPGFFAIEAARMVGPQGKVFAADLQNGMLEIVKRKVGAAGLENVISLHKCESSRIGIAEQVDFILIFYALHEVSDREAVLREMKSLLKPGGKILVVEPKFHVSKLSFVALSGLMRNIGFVVKDGPGIFFSRTAILTVPERVS